MPQPRHTGQGVPLLTSGCVATTIDWDTFYEAIAEVPSEKKDYPQANAGN